ncbi:laccase-15-like [Magnolia sinica]|uniref:laccase-15-like n=1 Tax=Magnolia sinica TaxID=86752 RepID=UPI0026594BD3|nr:laccase-15-like [Magnolia sinica]
MGPRKGLLPLLVRLVLFHGLFICMVSAKRHHQSFELRETPITRLCENKTILTINGQFPGPTLHARYGDTIVLNVTNRAKHNFTIHWHGVKQLRNPWGDGPEYITQCPIQPGATYGYEIVFTDEEGTLWWHAHSDWTRATVHGAIVIHPRIGKKYPFVKPLKEFTVILGEWWKSDVNDVLQEMLQTGGGPNNSDAFTINGQPGALYPCSKSDIFREKVFPGKTYLLRLINAAMNDELFFGIAQHRLKLVGMDGKYLKPFYTDYVMITPGQTMDLLIETNQTPNIYYMAAHAYSSGNVPFDNTTTTAILEYANITSSSSPSIPTLPTFNDTEAANNFTKKLKSLASEEHPAFCPQTINKHIYIAVSVKTKPCETASCVLANNRSLSASLNNISFVFPNISILQAYSQGINGVYDTRFPKRPPYYFNFTGDNLPETLLTPRRETQVKVLKFNSTVEIVYQGTSLVEGENHPLHLHGYSFYVVGWGTGNWDSVNHPRNYNLVDPPLINTVGVPRKGWVAIRFRANNPGVWFMHCHLERHLSWGMDTTLIVRNGKGPDAKMQPPPADLPPC